MQSLFSVLLSLQLNTGKSATEIQPALREEKLESDYKWLHWLQLTKYVRRIFR